MFQVANYFSFIDLIFLDTKEIILGGETQKGISRASKVSSKPKVPKTLYMHKIPITPYTQNIN